MEHINPHFNYITKSLELMKFQHQKYLTAPEPTGAHRNIRYITCNECNGMYKTLKTYQVYCKE